MHTGLILWLLPIALSVHVFEEFAYPGGSRDWIRIYKPNKPRANWYYVLANGPIILGAIIVALKANDMLGYRIYLFLVDVMGANAVSHIRGSFQQKQYCPGTISGSVLLLPLMILSNVYFFGNDQVDIISIALLICAGMLIGFYVGGIDIRSKDQGDGRRSG